MTEIYIVGGAVRDVLLGKSPKDVDYVVVGATPEEMISKGFKQVGADFPVFLDQNGQEFALARTERKTSAGYHGFEVNFDTTVTLEQDLLRRDLTINAMAVADKDWETFKQTRDPALVIDPYNGRKDLGAGVLRHVSAAFAEDPLRVLRVARFRGRYGFGIAPETTKLMHDLVTQGELNALTAERVWMEFEKGLMGEYPWMFIEALHLVGALEVLVPEYLDQGTMCVYYSLSDAGLLQLDLRSRFVAFFQAVPITRLEAMFERLKAPNDVRTFVKKVAVVEQYLCSKRCPESMASALEQLGVYKSTADLLEITKLYRLILTTNSMDNIKVLELLEVGTAASKIVFATLPADLRATLKGKEISQEIIARRWRLIQSNFADEKPAKEDEE